MLDPPPRDLRKQTLATRSVPTDALFRICRHATGEPYFGRRAINRFDDPRQRIGRRFGTCYCGLDMETAIAETILHDLVPRGGVFRLAAIEFSMRWMVRFEAGEELVLADLTGAALKRLGGTAALSGIIPYALPQKWSCAIHDHPQQVDGIYYMSRHLNDRAAIVVFDRAAQKFGTASYALLGAIPGIDQVRKSLGIVFAVP